MQLTKEESPKPSEKLESQSVEAIEPSQPVATPVRSDAVVPVVQPEIENKVTQETTPGTTDLQNAGDGKDQAIQDPQPKEPPAAKAEEDKAEGGEEAKGDSETRKAINFQTASCGFRLSMFGHLSIYSEIINVYTFKYIVVPTFQKEFSYIIRMVCLQVKLRNAAKSRLNRWVKPKTRRSELNAPKWLIDQWATGCKNEIADLLSHVNFKKDQPNFNPKNKTQTGSRHVYFWLVGIMIGLKYILAR